MFGGILRAAIGVMDAAGQRLPERDGRLERGKREPGVDPAANRVSDDAA